MTQTVFGQTDALALTIVAWMAAGAWYYQGQSTNPQSFCIPITPQRRFARRDDLASLPNYQQPALVDVFPGLEHGDSRGTSTAFESQYAIRFCIQQQLTGAASEEDQCALLSQLRSQIVEGIKTQRFNLTNAVHPVSNVFLHQIRNADRNDLYDQNILQNDHVFKSDTILIFKAAV